MVTVIGLGFVGLTTALGFAEKGKKVYGFEKNQQKKTQIINGKIPFYEPYLEDILKKNLKETFFMDKTLQEALNNSEFVFICVGTPANEDGSADLSMIYNSINEIADNVNRNRKLNIVIKSTVPPSTTKNEIGRYIESKGFTINKEIGLANNPEFLREGYSWEDFSKPDRIVIGVENEEIKSKFTELYKEFNAPIYFVNLNTGEFIKYLSNTLLATMISYSNEMSILSNAIGDIEIKNAFEILHKDKRWYGQPALMKNYVYPGCGYGGYCLPKDTKALYHAGIKNNYNPKILKSVIDVNNEIGNYIIKKIIDAAGEEKRIGILGLAFKPESDDVRDTPAKFIIEQMIKMGYSIDAYDPMANEYFNKEFKLNVNYLNSLEELVENNKLLVILTGWNEFIEKKDLFYEKKVLDYRYIL